MMMKDNNSPKGLGNDIIEIDRIRQSIERHGQHFLDRLFTQKEQDYCFKFKDPVPHFAGRFAAKSPGRTWKFLGMKKESPRYISLKA
jgi:holo-[acyl-carrier-protein] synthase